MISIEIDMSEDMPVHLSNWSYRYRMSGKTWKEVISEFHNTTGGQMKGVRGERTFRIIFKTEKDLVLYLMRFQ